MATFKYSIAVGWDASPGALDNVEDIVTHPPTSQPLPLGSVRRQTLDHAVQFNGTVSAFWKWDAISRADFDTLLTYLGSDLTVGSAHVTIKTRSPLDRWTIYNAILVNPQSGPDWSRGIGGYGAAEPLTLEFIIDSQTYDEILDENGFPILDENGDALLA